MVLCASFTNSFYAIKNLTLFRPTHVETRPSKTLLCKYILANPRQAAQARAELYAKKAVISDRVIISSALIEIQALRVALHTYFKVGTKLRTDTQLRSVIKASTKLYDYIEYFIMLLCHQPSGTILYSPSHNS